MNEFSSKDGMDQNFTNNQTDFQALNDQGVNSDIPSIGRNSSLKLRMFCDQYKFDSLLHICVRNNFIKQHHKSRWNFFKAEITLAKEIFS